MLENICKVSVIMPCYNVERYVADTIESVMSQTYSDFELIMIDDGSADGTLSILRDYEKRYPNIRVLADTNHGQGYQRNVGINLAKGKYIYFMDSDDILDRECLEVCVREAEQNCLDLLFFEGRSFYESDDLEERFPYFKDAYRRKNRYPEVYSGKELFCELKKNDKFIISPCLQFVRRQHLIDNGICFPSMPVFEDNIYIIKNIVLAGRVKCIDAVMFNRRVRAGSVMTGKRVENEIRSYNMIIEELIDFSKQYRDDKELSHALSCQLESYRKQLNKCYEKIKNLS